MFAILNIIYLKTILEFDNQLSETKEVSANVTDQMEFAIARIVHSKIAEDIIKLKSKLEL
jgi:hypothetical protein